MLNWKLRLKNKTTLIALIAALAALVYQILSAFGITPSISEDTVLEIAGVADSDRALEYTELSGDEGEGK